MGVAITMKKKLSKQDQSDQNLERLSYGETPLARKDHEVELLFKEADKAGSILENAKSELRLIHIAISQATCPFKPGQVLKTTRGLGLNGLKVMEYIVPPTNPGSGPMRDNRWAIHTLSYDKVGALTKRFVVITEERMRDGTFGEINVKEKK